MSNSIVHVSTQAFDEFVSKHPLILVDFWAPWCGPCRMVAPVMEELAQRMEGKAIIAKANIDEEPDLAARFGVESIPTIMVFQNGKEVARDVGARPLAHYQSMLEKAMA